MTWWELTVGFVTFGIKIWALVDCFAHPDSAFRAADRMTRPVWIVVLAAVIALDETVTVPAGTFLHCLKTKEFTPIEPGSTGSKYYAPGIGIVLQVDGQTGDRTELIQIIN